jgi:hypothetical protein
LEDALSLEEEELLVTRGFEELSVGNLILGVESKTQ